MTTPDTGATPTGPMTLESGLAALKAKMAGRKTTAADQVTAELDDDGLEVPVDETEQPEPETTVETEDNTEAVSEDESQAEAQKPDDRPVILPDGSQITVEEARKGYLRQADFTRKTQDIAKEREVLTAEKATAFQQIGTLYQQLASLQEQEPNWLQLAADPSIDPKQLQYAQAQWTNRKTILANAQAALQQQQANSLAFERQKTFNTLNAGEFDPSWKDPKALRTALETISSYAIERGLPAELLDQITFPAAIEMMEESRRYRELQKAKPKAALAVKGKPKPFMPGAKSTASPQSETIRLLNEAFRKNPSVDNAARLEEARAKARSAQTRR